MRRRIGIWLLASLLVWSAAGCGTKNAAADTAAEKVSAYLRLYCPADLSEKNRSAGGGDAVNGIPISWKQVRGDDRGRQQQAQYIMELLLGDCTDKDFICPVPKGTAVNSCTVTGGTVSVDLSREYEQLVGVERTIADYCITLSLMQLDGIYAVRLTVNGLLPEGFAVLDTKVEDGTCYLNLAGSVTALLPEDSAEQEQMIQGLVDSLCSLEDVSQVQLMVDGEYQMMLGCVPISRPLLPTNGHPEA